MLLALRSEDPADDRLKSLLGRPLPDDAEHAEALSLLRAHRAMDQARAYVATEAQAARDLLQVVPNEGVREALDRFAVVLTERSA